MRLDWESFLPLESLDPEGSTSSDLRLVPVSQMLLPHFPFPTPVWALRPQKLPLWPGNLGLFIPTVSCLPLVLVTWPAC